MMLAFGNTVDNQRQVYRFFLSVPNILGSKKKGTTLLRRTAANDGCRGLSNRLRSNGITTDGTDSIRIFPSVSQSAPNCRDCSSTNAQLPGNTPPMRSSIVIQVPSGTSISISTLSIGRTEVCTAYSSAARATEPAAYMIGCPLLC